MILVTERIAADTLFLGNKRMMMMSSFGNLILHRKSSIVTVTLLLS